MNAASQQPTGPHSAETRSAEPAPLGTDTFEALLEDLVRESAPRVFAVVQELGEREDGWVAAWGMAFEDRAEVLGVHCNARMSLRSPESALRYFNAEADARPRLVWVRDCPGGK